MTSNRLQRHPQAATPMSMASGKIATTIAWSAATIVKLRTSRAKTLK